MCVYCMCGDWMFRHNPPWNPPYPSPFIPAPQVPLPVAPWGLDKLKEFEELLARIKALEDRLGCPCEPNKADYLSIMRARIEELEKKVVSQTSCTSS